MLATSVPARFGIPWGNSAGGAYIRAIPQASQIGITAGAASLTDGFPPLNFTQIGAGGVPPFGQDFNGILNQITKWDQWVAAGGPIPFDAAFAASIGGYPKGAILSAGTGGTTGQFWLNSIDGNTSNPDTGGANWLAQFFIANLTGITGLVPGTYTRLKGQVDAFGRLLTAFSGAQPTYQKFTTGSGVYTPSVGTVRARVRMAGGGGGANAIGGAGGTTSLGGWTAIGGGQGQGGGVSGGGGVGGTGGSNGTGVLIDRNAGAPGTFGISFTGTAIAGAIGSANMSPGGTNRLGGGPNSGQGAPGGNSQSFNNTTVITGGAGGAGEYVEFDIINPGALNYTVGAGATNAQAGVILVQEFYD